MQIQRPYRQLFNRDLSWLSFNDRVLSEAADRTVPALERLRFAAIVSSNLNEFFMVRVAEIARTARNSPRKNYPDGLTAAQLSVQIREEVLRQKSRQAAVLEDILHQLRRSGITVHTRFDGPDPALDAEIRKSLQAIKFTRRKTAEPLPALQSDRLHIFVRFHGEYAIITLEERERR